MAGRMGFRGWRAAIGAAVACGGSGALAHPCEGAGVCSNPSPVVKTTNGLVQGFDRTVEGADVSTFWAVPYAEPPVGAKRFLYPEPYTQQWTGVRAATQQAPPCAQGGGGSEDCLYVNVYVPRNALQGNSSGSKLPVMFWIYGGGYSEGDAYTNIPGGALYDGAHLAGRHNVIVVTHGYRLNLLGFNTFAKGPHGETGTQAMADQRMAMQWTSDNIANFGGDPSKVTIFGESAGAFSVMYHLVSPPSWTLFSKAIMQSGTSRVSWFFQPEDLATDMNQGWATASGCPTGAGQLACLQGKPATDFSSPPRNYHGRSPSWPVFPVGPVIDGTEYGLLDMPATLVANGQHAKVPLIIGANRDDGSIFVPILATAIPKMPIVADSSEDIDRALNWTFHQAEHDEVRSVYPISEFQPIGIDPWQKMLSRILRDAAFQCSDRFVATHWHAHGLDVFVYTLSFDLGPVEKLFRLGDFHGADIIFVFRSGLWIAKLFPLHGNVQLMADTISCMWTSYARTGNPNGQAGHVQPGCQDIHGQVDEWPQFADDRQYYSLDYEGSERPKVVSLRPDNRYPNDEFPSDKKCDVWDTITFPWHAPSTGGAQIVV